MCSSTFICISFTSFLTKIKWSIKAAKLCVELKLEKKLKFFKAYNYKHANNGNLFIVGNLTIVSLGLASLTVI